MDNGKMNSEGKAMHAELAEIWRDIDRVGERRPRASGIPRIFAAFPGHSIQHDLRPRVERGENAAVSRDAALKDVVALRVRNRLSVKVDARIVPFERSGARKVTLTIREASEVA